MYIYLNNRIYIYIYFLITNNRCMKPNKENKSNNFNSKIVREQLKSKLIIETISFRKYGYAHQINISNFVNRYCN